MPFQETPTIDPMTNGVRLVMQDNMANRRSTRRSRRRLRRRHEAGWKVHTFPTGMTAQYKNAGTVVPLINGIKKLKFVLKSGQGITKFKRGRQERLVSGRPSATSPVKVTFIADPPLAETGQCCEMFPGPAPRRAAASSATRHPALQITAPIRSRASRAGPSHLRGTHRASGQCPKRRVFSSQTPRFFLTTPWSDVLRAPLCRFSRH
jgi:hypothetical protein